MRGRLLLLLILTFLLVQPATVKSQKYNFQEDTKKKIEFIDPIPFTNPPKKPIWRLGFHYKYKENSLFLLELKPPLCKERDRLAKDAYRSPDRPSTECVFFVPFSKLKTKEKQNIVNPRKWYILGINHIFGEKSFTKLAIVITACQSGCFYMGSEYPENNTAFYPHEKVPNDTSPFSVNEDLIIGIAGNLKKYPIVRLPSTEIKNSIDEPHFLPEEYTKLLDMPIVKKRLGKDQKKFRASSIIVEGHSIKATIDSKHPKQETLWIIRWKTESDAPFFEGMMLWGIFNVTKNGLKPIYLSNKIDPSLRYDYKYWPEFIAAVDLDVDGIDELILHAGYSEGSSYKVFAFKKNRFVEIYNSEYYGL